MRLTKSTILLFSLLLPAACAVLPLPGSGDFPLDPGIADTDTNCPKLTGIYSATPNVSVLSAGHRQRFKGTSFDFISIFMLGRIDDQHKSTLQLLDPPLEKNDFFIRITELDDQFLLDSVHGDGSKINREDITSIMSARCDSDGTRWMLVDDIIGGSEGVILNARWIRKIAKAINGDLLVYLAIVNAKPTIRRVVAEHYLFRFKSIDLVPKHQESPE